MNRTERLLDLITYLLNSQEPVSWQEIKNHFAEDYARGVEESNQRKFERDKAELISLGIPIDYQPGTETVPEGYLIDKERFFLPEIEFSPTESSLLMLSASAVLESEGFPYRDQLESALLKIISIHDAISPPPPQISITHSRRAKPALRSPWIQRLQDALDRKKTVEIVYHAFSTGKTNRRKVNPYGLIFRRGNWTLIGWDHLRKDIRSFVLTRIQKLKVNSRRPGTADFEIPEHFSLKRFQIQQPWEIDAHKPIDVTLRVSQHRLPELTPQLVAARRLGERTFSLRVTNRLGLISWLLYQKTDVEVLSPPEIQKGIREALETLL